MDAYLRGVARDGDSDPLAARTVKQRERGNRPQRALLILEDCRDRTRARQGMDFCRAADDVRERGLIAEADPQAAVSRGQQRRHPRRRQARIRQLIPWREPRAVEAKEARCRAYP